jgi:uncharacterized tellurite resistance protein B-like protein
MGPKYGGTSGGRGRTIRGMQFTDLHADEQLALVALSRAIVRADDVVTPAEGHRVARIALELGEQAYRREFARAVESFPDEAALKRFLMSIQRHEARLVIYDTVLDLAAADELTPAEEPLIRWLEMAWGVG